jgi:hypothetical protein
VKREVLMSSEHALTAQYRPSKTILASINATYAWLIAFGTPRNSKSITPPLEEKQGIEEFLATCYPFHERFILRNRRLARKFKRDLHNTHRCGVSFATWGWFLQVVMIPNVFQYSIVWIRRTRNIFPSSDVGSP